MLAAGFGSHPMAARERRVEPELDEDHQTRQQSKADG